MAAIAALAPLSAARAGDPKDHSTDLGVNNFGNLAQQCGFAKGGCAPTAAANSMTFLQNDNPRLGNSLTPLGPLGAQTELAVDMATNPTTGSTFILNFISGKQKYFSDHAVPATFAAQVDPQLLNPSEQTAASAIPGTTVGSPTGSFLANELADHEDVEMLFNGVKPDGSVDPTVGHYVTVVDLNWYDQDANGMIDKSDWTSATNHAAPTLGYMDPFGGLLRDGIPIWEQGGHLQLIGPLTGNLFYATAIVSESPIRTPEPATWVTMTVGFAGLGAAMRTVRRRAHTAA